MAPALAVAVILTLSKTWLLAVTMTLAMAMFLT